MDSEQQPCEVCDGRGHHKNRTGNPLDDLPCAACRGTGLVPPADKSIQRNIARTALREIEAEIAGRNHNEAGHSDYYYLKQIERIVSTAFATPDAAPRSADASPDYAQEAERTADNCTDVQQPEDRDDGACVECITHLAQRVARETREACAKVVDDAAKLKREAADVVLSGFPIIDNANAAAKDMQYATFADQIAAAIRTALKGKSGVLIADDDSPAVYQPMNLSGEAVGGRVVVPAKEKCEECNGSGTSCTGGNCCMTCSECNGTGTA